MPEIQLSICTDYLPIESYVDDVLGQVRLFDIDIDYHCGADEGSNYRFFEITTKHDPFEIKRECMSLEKRNGKRIGDIDIDVYYTTANGMKTRKKIYRWNGDFIRWRIKNNLKKISDNLRDWYLTFRGSENI
jgi:hypothetical protein